MKGKREGFKKGRPGYFLEWPEWQTKSGSYPVNNREILKVSFWGERHDQSEALGKINLRVMSRKDCKDSKQKNLLLTTATISVWCNKDWLMVVEWARMEKEGMGQEKFQSRKGRACQKRQGLTVRVGRNGELIINPKFLPCLEMFINFWLPTG